VVPVSGAEIGLARRSGAEAGRRLGGWGALLGCGLAVAAILTLALGPLGWRIGLWHFRFAFGVLMPCAAYGGLAAAMLSTATLILARARLDRRVAALAVAGVVVGAFTAYLPWHFSRLGQSLPHINDITTDSVDPPTLAAVLPARAAEAARTAQYAGPAVAREQQAGYPDIAPLKTVLPPTETFAHALETALSMQGWRIVAVDPATGRIEGSQSSFWFGFTDDFVIRIRPDGSGSRVDMRSLSRQGRGDFGVNATRVRAYLAALAPKLE
jgi:uncharacterized protein (DUF1499 family)